MKGQYVVTAKDSEDRKRYWTGRYFVLYGEKPLLYFPTLFKAVVCARGLSNTFANMSDFKAEGIVEFKEE